MMSGTRMLPVVIQSRTEVSASQSAEREAPGAATAVPFLVRIPLVRKAVLRVEVAVVRGEDDEGVV